CLAVGKTAKHFVENNGCSTTNYADGLHRAAPPWAAAAVESNLSRYRHRPCHQRCTQNPTTGRHPRTAGCRYDQRVNRPAPDSQQIHPDNHPPKSAHSAHQDPSHCLINQSTDGHPKWHWPPVGSQSQGFLDAHCCDAIQSGHLPQAPDPCPPLSPAPHYGGPPAADPPYGQTTVPTRHG